MPLYQLGLQNRTQGHSHGRLLHVATCGQARQERQFDMSSEGESASLAQMRVEQGLTHRAGDKMY